MCILLLYVSIKLRNQVIRDYERVRLFISGVLACKTKPELIQIGVWVVTTENYFVWDP